MRPATAKLKHISLQVANVMVCQVIAVVVSLVLAFGWAETTHIFGEERSVLLLVCTLLAGGAHPAAPCCFCRCASSTRYHPTAAALPPAYGVITPARALSSCYLWCAHGFSVPITRQGWAACRMSRIGASLFVTKGRTPQRPRR